MAAKKHKATKLKTYKVRKPKFKSMLLEAMDLPVETDALTPKLTMVGKSKLLIENHNGVLQYNSNLVRFLSHEGTLEIKGNGLILKQLAYGRAYINGVIECISYLE